jgi:hypothetical protein
MISKTEQVRTIMNGEIGEAKVCDGPKNCQQSQSKMKVENMSIIAKFGEGYGCYFV